MSDFSEQILQQSATRLAERLRQQGLMLAVAESCTGGWVAKVCTDLPGSSHWFERGFVTYTNEAKQELLSVPADLLARHGAVSEAVVAAMASGTLEHSRAQLSLAISGIAGPGGAVEGKPVGTVFHAWALQSATGPRVLVERHQYSGDREAVRRQAVHTALEGALRVIADE